MVPGMFFIKQCVLFPEQQLDNHSLLHANVELSSDMNVSNMPSGGEDKNNNSLLIRIRIYKGTQL
jgi:hypothetical protein